MPDGMQVTDIFACVVFRRTKRRVSEVAFELALKGPEVAVFEFERCRALRVANDDEVDAMLGAAGAEGGEGSVRRRNGRDNETRFWIAHGEGLQGVLESETEEAPQTADGIL